MTDDEIWHLQRGGLDPQKVYNAYKRAVEHTGSADDYSGQDRQGLRTWLRPQARNATHQEKKMTDEAMVLFRHAL